MHRSGAAPHAALLTVPHAARSTTILRSREVTAVNDRPVHLVVSDDQERSRLSVFFRVLLAIPHLIWLSL
jgi:hypothetical protein